MSATVDTVEVFVTSSTVAMFRPGELVLEQTSGKWHRILTVDPQRCEVRTRPAVFEDFAETVAEALFGWLP